MDRVARRLRNINFFARFGCLARAASYFLMGGFAVLAAMGDPDGAATDSKGALRQLLEHRFGDLLLFVLALGFFSYAIWRFALAIRDYDGQGTSAKGLIVRTGSVFGGLAHIGLGVYALNLVFYFSSTSSGGERGIAHRLLILPFGQILTGAVGLAIIGFGVSQIAMAWKEKFTRRLSIPTDRRRIVMPICKFGLIARGAVFGLIGGFFLQAALHYSSREAGGVARAWGVLQNQPFGQALFLAVASGFVAFGVYGVTEALYQKEY